ncbi:DUF5765 domain-containing protein [Roseibacterium beibuensis]|uniref:Uncharacterized protein n=1 Tax=[Roseibacterium] beibuensis TaxID=1193142 RepID=A0ABP9L3M4_9RHOB|nr:DUF5765 domain-containing protein [Roseibacterium beibuensis]MCS6621570.1 DUF5765 domain-containing protein [Roseibacterium beibuensis]
MCWSEGASLAMVGVGAVATVVTIKRGDPIAIPVTLAFFAAMEALQVWGYEVIDQCGTPSNRWATILSWVHISLQPIFINAFAMAIAAPMLSRRARLAVLAAAGVASVLLLARMVPLEWAGMCRPGTVLCGAEWCTITGTWHLAWDMPLNDLASRLLGVEIPGGWTYPDYMLAVFVLPLVYGAWRLVIVHLVLGPALAIMLTDMPNEMPAVWCLFSIGLVLIGLSPLVRRKIAPGQRAAP